MLKRTLKNAAGMVAPRLTEEALAYLRLFKEARELRDCCARAGNLEFAIEQACGSATFGACQRKGEILQLLSLLKDRSPRRILEIGSARGGTLFLFSQMAAHDAAILSIDAAYGRQRRWAHRRLRHWHQQIACLCADSHSPATEKYVREWLGTEKLDFLFIDGDHSYDGVSSDYRMYSPHVRHGGIIALHDIVPDYKTRYGTITQSDVGEVPQFWTELKRTSGFRFVELIEDPEQDGYGIGVLHVGEMASVKADDRAR